MAEPEKVEGEVEGSAEAGLLEQAAADGTCAACHQVFGELDQARWRGPRLSCQEFTGH